MDAAHHSQAPRRRGPKLAPLVLTNEERTTLVRWARRRTSSQALALRCRMVLACAEGASNVEVATRLGVSLPTVGKWRARFLARRLEGLHDEPRPGARRTITDEQSSGCWSRPWSRHPPMPHTGRRGRWPGGWG
jgi:hypothetical protein